MQRVKKRGSAMTKFTTAFSLFVLLSGLSVAAFGSQKSVLWETVESGPNPLQPAKLEEGILDPQPGVLETPDGEVLGTVIDFIFDLRMNRILYTVGVLHSPEEFANRVFVFPWGVAPVDINTNSFTLKGGQAILQKAPSFPVDAWPNFPSARWTTAIDAAWKEDERLNVAMASASDPVLSRAGELIGKTVKTVSGENVGTLAELLIDREKARLRTLLFPLTTRTKTTALSFIPCPGPLCTQIPRGSLLSFLILSKKNCMTPYSPFWAANLRSRLLAFREKRPINKAHFCTCLSGYAYF